MAYGYGALAALSDPTRRAILEKLRAGAMPVGEIAAGMTISRPAVSQHLKVLKQSGLVAETRHGTRHYFAIAPEGIGELRAYLDGLWSDALAAFGRYDRGVQAMKDEDVARLPVPPVETEVLVPCDPARAFRAFTAEISRWWPLGTHSVGQAKALSVAIEPWVGGRVYETVEGGGAHEWGRILIWSPPAGFSMSWHPGRAPSPHTVVELRFSAEPGGTRVRLLHRGWEALGPEGRAKRDDYDRGWQPILTRDFTEHFTEGS